MAEDIIPVQEQVQASTQTELPQEIREQMEISLNGGIVPEKPATEVVVEQQQQAAATSSVDPFGLFKEKFGYQTPDEAIADIEGLRAFKAKPPVAELNFENEDSARIVKALQAGKVDEVREFLDRNWRIDRLVTGEVTKETAADIVKLGMQLKFKDLSTQEIDYKFNKQFGVPAKPTQGADEDADDFQGRLSTWESIATDKTMDLMIEAKMSRPELANSKSKLVIPEIESETNEEFTQWKKSLTDNQKAVEDAAQAVEVYKTFTPKTIETKVDFNDEANKIAFQFQYEPDAEGFAKAVEIASDMDNFNKTFSNQDGTPNRQKFLEVLYFGLNKDKVIMEALKQSKNGTIKASLPDNSSGGLVRQLPQGQELSEFDKQMRESLKGFGGY